MTPEEFYRVIPRERLLQTVRNTPSPCYLFFEPIIAERVAQVREALGARFDLHYAVKANPHPAILRTMHRLSLGVDVASGNELLAALRVGFDPERIEFSGPGKTTLELACAVDAHIGAINVESLGELELLIGLAKQKGKRPRIGLRVNPSVKAKAGLRMAGATQFGLSEDDLEVALEHAGREASAVDFVGLHLHIGSQVLDVESALEVFRIGIELARRVARRTGKPPRKLNFGGGWGVTYFEGQKPLDTTAVCLGIQTLLEREEFSAGIECTRLIVEPGRYLVAESGIYVAQVLYRKESAGKHFAIVHGGMHHNYLLAGGMGQVIRRNFFLDFLPEDGCSGTTAEITLNIAGCLCTPQDLLAQDVVTRQEVRPGDYVVFFNCGAYGATASPIHFLSHPEPALVLVT
jgi:diaminopimelate decarboxylase